MRKILTGVVIVSIILVMLFTLTACNKYKWDPVGGTDEATAEVESEVAPEGEVAETPAE